MKTTLTVFATTLALTIPGLTLANDVSFASPKFYDAFLEKSAKSKATKLDISTSGQKIKATKKKAETKK